MIARCGGHCGSCGRSITVGEDLRHAYGFGWVHARCEPIEEHLAECRMAERRVYGELRQRF